MGDALPAAGLRAARSVAANIAIRAKGLLHSRKVLSRDKLSRAEVMNYQIEQSRQQRRALSNLITLTDRG